METSASSPSLSLAAEQQTAGGGHAWRTLWIVVGAAAALGAASHNPILTPASLLLWPPLIYLTWRPGEPPALMFVIAMHWLQAASAIFYTDFFSASLADAFGGIELESATWLSLCGVLALAVGMRLGWFRAAPTRGEEIAAEGASVDVGKAFTAYSVAFVLSFACAIGAARIPGISQPLIMLGAVKWVFVFIVGYAILEQRRGYIFLGLVVALELGVGFLGFFASFKSVFFVLFVALVTSPLALRGRRLLLLTSTALLLLLLGTVWTAVKSDYREFLNQGFRSQEVLVPVEERVGKLGDLLDGFDAQQLAEGFQTMILRISYVQFFALTMKNVPANVPYENGRLWMGAIDDAVRGCLDQVQHVAFGVVRGRHVLSVRTE